MNDTPAAIWTTTAYRVQSLDRPYIELGQEVKCFRNLVDAYAYVEAWYGAPCTLFEVSGTVLKEDIEDFQVDFREGYISTYNAETEKVEDLDYSVCHKISVVTLKVTWAKVLGGFSYEESIEEGAKTWRWKYTRV